MKLAKYKRYLAVARSRMAYENYWRELLAFDMEMQGRGVIIGLRYWQVKPGLQARPQLMGISREQELR